MVVVKPELDIQKKDIVVLQRDPNKSILSYFFSRTIVDKLISNISMRGGNGRYVQDKIFKVIKALKLIHINLYVSIFYIICRLKQRITTNIEAVKTRRKPYRIKRVIIKQVKLYITKIHQRGFKNLRKGLKLRREVLLFDKVINEIKDNLMSKVTPASLRKTLDYRIAWHKTKVKYRDRRYFKKSRRINALLTQIMESGSIFYKVKKVRLFNNIKVWRQEDKDWDSYLYAIGANNYFVPSFYLRILRHNFGKGILYACKKLSYRISKKRRLRYNFKLYRRRKPWQQIRYLYKSVFKYTLSPKYSVDSLSNNFSFSTRFNLNLNLNKIYKQTLLKFVIYSITDYFKNLLLKIYKIYWLLDRIQNLPKLIKLNLISAYLLECRFRSISTNTYSELYSIKWLDF